MPRPMGSREFRAESPEEIAAQISMPNEICGLLKTNAANLFPMCAAVGKQKKMASRQHLEELCGLPCTGVRITVLV